MAEFGLDGWLLGSSVETVWMVWAFGFFSAVVALRVFCAKERGAENAEG